MLAGRKGCILESVIAEQGQPKLVASNGI
jgi:hypothetical protein